MKLYVRVLMAGGLIEYGVFALCCALGYVAGWAWYGIAGLWLLTSERLVKRYLLPPLFPHTRCHCCHERIALSARWKRGEQWTDGKVRHALRVYSPGEHEIGSFSCPSCGTTIELQKVTKKRLANWVQADAQSSSARLQHSGDGIELGTEKDTLPTGMVRLFCRWFHLPIGKPVLLEFPMLTKHTAIFGSTGYGKSTLIVSLIKQLMCRGEGLTVLDPAGDLAQLILKHVPADRVDDVLYLNVENQNDPFPFNILHETDRNDRNQLPDEIISLFKNLYASSWGDKCTYQLRMALNAALEIGGSLADVYALFANPDARHRLASQLQDPELRDFWEEKILNPNNQATRYSMINKLTEIVKHPFIGPIISSRSCILDADQVITGKKILIVNLNTGSKPGHTATILGTFVVSKIISAAYRQSRKKHEFRTRHHLFVDEFQNFLNRSFDWKNGLSQVRKFKLSLCLVTQYAEAIPKPIRSAIFGNVGILAAFRLGHEDAAVLKDEFGCREKRQLMRQPVGECRVRIGSDHGVVKTTMLGEPEDDRSREIAQRMRAMVRSFRELEQDNVQSEYELAREIRCIEQQALQGELVLCEYA